MSSWRFFSAHGNSRKDPVRAAFGAVAPVRNGRERRGLRWPDPARSAAAGPRCRAGGQVGGRAQPGGRGLARVQGRALAHHLRQPPHVVVGVRGGDRGVERGPGRVGRRRGPAGRPAATASTASGRTPRRSQAGDAAAGQRGAGPVRARPAAQDQRPVAVVGEAVLVAQPAQLRGGGPSPSRSPRIWSRMRRRTAPPRGCTGGRAPWPA